MSIIFNLIFKEPGRFFENGELHSIQRDSGNLDGPQCRIQSDQRPRGFPHMRFRDSWKRDGHPGGPHNQTYADPDQWLSG